MRQSIDDNIDILIDLGLTQNQAKIYLANLKTGSAPAKTIAQCAKIGREDVYRVLPSLQNLGLVKKHISSPTFYEPVTPNDAITLLISNKLEEFSSLRRRAIDFLRDCKKITPVSLEPESFVMVTNETIAIKMLTGAIKKAQKSWLFTSGYERFITRQNMPKKRLQIEEMCKAVQRGVEIRAVLDQPKDRNKLHPTAFAYKSSKTLIAHDNFKYKYLDSPHVGLLAVFDDNIMFIETQQGPRVLIPQLWSNNQVLLGLGKSFFEHAWTQAYCPE